MDIRGTRTEKNLEQAFAAESMAHSAFLYYAETAKKEGQELVSDVFSEIAGNEREHARAHFQLLLRMKDTRSNLEAAIAREEAEHSALYGEFARVAEEEGFREIADSFRRMGNVEGGHREILEGLLGCLDRGVTPAERTAGHSAVTLVQVMLPEHANPAGFVHGGEIMKLMDNAAGVAAARHAHTNVVTARVEEINFLKPVRVGDVVFAHALLTFAARSSMEIRVEVETENIGRERREKALTAFFIYVALDASGKPARVPSLLITTEEGQTLFLEGRRRYENRKKSSG